METSPAWLRELYASVDWSKTEPAVDQVRLVDYPVALGMRQYEEVLDLLREFQLIVLDQDASANSAPAELVHLAEELTGRYGPMISSVHEARERAFRAGHEYMLMTYPFVPQAREFSVEYAKVLAHADAFCRSGFLMHLESSPELKALRRWSVEEVVRQFDGLEPRPWPAVRERLIEELSAAAR